MKELNEYYINKNTCAIISIGKEISRVIEYDNVFIVNKSSTQIVSDSCKYFGSSYRGRLEGSRDILNMTYKLPIVIEDYNTTIFFPTSSPRFEHCSWICLNKIESYIQNNKKSTVIFSDCCSVDLDISYYSLENQIFRASMLELSIRKHKNSIIQS